MGKSKAPEYAKTTYNTGGLFGSSTSDKGGTSYTPESWMTNTMNTVGTGVNTSLQNMFSNDYENDANFNAYRDNLYNTMGQQYDQVLGNLADRGLMRSTGLQALNNNYAKALQDNVTSLYDNYYNRQANNLQNAMNTSNSIYNYVNGITGNNMQNSNAVSDYNMKAYQADQANKQAMWNTLGQAAAAVGSIAAAPMTGGTSIAGTIASNLAKEKQA
ncbi:MAG: hypothetical protein II304_03065 [Bacteroidales bacterium]|nr:hypothetical protein [Bacteroidales bacterium]